MRDVNNGEDILDSRDIIKRIQELEEYRDTAADPSADQVTFTAPDGTVYAETSDYDESVHDELSILLALAEDGSDSADWQHGETLIRDTYFEQYARDLAEDIGVLVEHCNRWPATCIDWERAAEELQQDYSQVMYGDVAYWIRA